MAHIIAGGGIAGLAAALGLARAGREVRLFEAEAEFSEMGAGLQLGPNGVKALKALGAWEAVEPHCFAPKAIQIRDGISGRTLKKLNLKAFSERFGAPYRVLHRGDLLTGLLQTARKTPRIELNLNAKITGFSSQMVHFEQGPDQAYSLLLGADGIGSNIRRQLLADGKAPYAGQMIARALIDINKLKNPKPDVGLWLCPGGHVVSYPVSNGQKLNLVAAFDSPQMAEGFMTQLPREQLLRAFPQACKALTELLRLPESWRQWPGLVRPAAKIWGKANVSLIGDAAHPTLPYLAQGAVMALEDAATLSRLLPQAPDITSGLRKYEQARMPRTAAIVAAASGITRAYHAQGFIRQSRNFVLSTIPDNVMLAQMAKLYDWNPP